MPSLSEAAPPLGASPREAAAPAADDLDGDLGRGSGLDGEAAARAWPPLNTPGPWRIGPDPAAARDAPRAAFDVEDDGDTGTPECPGLLRGAEEEEAEATDGAAARGSPRGAGLSTPGRLGPSPNSCARARAMAGASSRRSREHRIRP